MGILPEIFDIPVQLEGAVGDASRKITTEEEIEKAKKELEKSDND